MKTNLGHTIGMGNNGKWSTKKRDTDKVLSLRRKMESILLKQKLGD